MARPRIAANQRTLELPDGKPWFWLADTAWEMFHRLTLREAEHYLETRVRQGFTVIQAVGLAELDGVREPNRNGDVPLLDEDATRPNEAYWEHVDEVLDYADKLGLNIAFLPTWGDKIDIAWGAGPVIFSVENARVFGRFLGQRYRDRDNLIWVNGGDREPIETQDIWRALAEGLIEGDGGKQRLMTWHPQGDRSSADEWSDESWLDFHMLQTGHSGPRLPYIAGMIERTRRINPTKPVLDGEPCYENHPIGFNASNGFFKAGQVRTALYTSVFAGGCGVTYGCHAVWQCASDLYPPVNNPISNWRSSLELPGANQVRHLRSLWLEVGLHTFLPDPLVLETGSSFRAMKEEGSQRAVVYSHEGERIRLSNLYVRQGVPAARWFDPCTGEYTAAEPPVNGHTFVTPERKNDVRDWVLVLG